MFKIFLFIASLLTSIMAYGSGDIYSSQCASFPKPLPGSYCLHVPTQNPSGDIIYHLHGRGGSELNWQGQWGYPEQLRTEWLQKNVALPAVISISFGPIWLLAEKNSSEHSGLFELLSQKIIPALEAKLGGLKGRRMIVGESMGGFNTTQLALKTDLFSKAAILCTPMADVSIFSSDEVINEYIKNTSAWNHYKETPTVVLSSVEGVIQLGKFFFPTQEDWNRANPLDLAKQTTTKTELYVSIGYIDEYASYEANQKFVEILKEKNVAVEWRPMWGNHCVMDITSLADFLVK